MPNLSIKRQKRERAKATPKDLFYRFYGGFGLVITVALFLACLTAVGGKLQLLESLLPILAGWPLLWGLCFGAWVKRLTWAWCLSCTVAIVGELIIGLQELSTPPLLAIAFGTAGFVCLAYLAITSIKLYNFPNQ